MAYEFRFPDLGEGIAEAEIAAWRVAVGDLVEEDDPLLEVHTDKAIMEIPSPVSGTVTEILVAEGQRVMVGTVMIVVDDGVPAGVGPMRAPIAAAVPAGAGAGAGGGAGGGVKAAPYVRRLAAEAGLDLADVLPSGGDGRVLEEDVRGVLAHANSAANGRPVDDPRGVRREPLVGVRRLTAENMARAHREVPAVTIVEECDFTHLKRLRLSYLPLVVAATVSALRAHPELNATVDGSYLLKYERHDIGIATQTSDGLVVPVLRDAGALSGAALETELRRLNRGALDRTLRPSEMRASTFTITSAGRSGGLFATPLVNHPEVAILGLHRIARRPVVRGDKVVVRRMGMVSVTFDHRAADGLRAGSFLRHVIRELSRDGRRRDR
jgi:pyruvate dehydrogenase E2 component (dihydrolipoamide acetyltransferase)